MIHDRDPLLRQWARWQKGEGRAETTIHERARVLDSFAALTGVVPSRATADDVIGYLAIIAGLRPATKATYFGHVKTWFDWLISQDHRDDHPCAKITAPRFPRRKPRPISDEQLRRLLDTRMHRRCYTMIMLAAFQGLRVHEIAKIRGEDVDVLDGTLRVIGKGDHDDLVSLHALVAAEARFYPSQGYWFPTYVGNVRGAAGPVLPGSVSDTIAKAMTRAYISGGAHRLRHWYATKLVEEGVDIRIVQELLRHASLQSTQIYTKVTMSQQRRALDRLHKPADDPAAAEIAA